MSGVHLTTLIRSGGLVVEKFGCRSVSVAVVVPPTGDVPDPVGQFRAAKRAFLAVQQSTEDAAHEPRSGTIYHTFSAHETLPAFLWASVRDGLMAVVKR